MLNATIKEKEPFVYAIHEGIRKDIVLFRSIGSHWQTLNEITFEEIKAYMLFHLSGIEAHHHGEEDFFFPRYLQKAPDLAEAVDALQKQHHELLDRIKALKEALIANSRNSLEGLIRDYGDFIETHLSQEEDTVFTPVFNQLMTEESLAIADEYSKNRDKKQGLILLPWILHYMDDETREMFFKKVPFFVPYFYRYVMKPKFDKQITVFDRAKA